MKTIKAIMALLLFTGMILSCGRNNNQNEGAADPVERSTTADTVMNHTDTTAAE